MLLRFHLSAEGFFLLQYSISGDGEPLLDDYGGAQLSPPVLVILLTSLVYYGVTKERPRWLVPWIILIGPSKSLAGVCVFGARISMISIILSIANINISTDSKKE